MFDYAKARTNMVDCQIHTSGVVNPDLLRAFETVPRENFVPEKSKSLAYFDEDLSIGNGRFLLEPMAYSRMLQIADLKKDDVVLDIGCATGYSSAILSSIVSTVVALDQDQELLDQAQKNWEGLDICNVVAVSGQHKEGAADNAPYSLIVINGAVSEIPENLMKQLSPEGRLVTILKKPGQSVGEIVIAKRNNVDNLGETSFSSYSLFNAATPYLTGFEPESLFSF